MIRISSHSCSISVRSLLTACLISVAISSSAQERGAVVVPDGKGSQIELYGPGKSHALLIGVSDYTAGWPDLESIPRELEQVRKVLEEQHFNVRVAPLNPDDDELSDAFRNFIDDYGFEPGNRLLFFLRGYPLYWPNAMVGE